MRDGELAICLAGALAAFIPLPIEGSTGFISGGAAGGAYYWFAIGVVAYWFAGPGRAMSRVAPESRRACAEASDRGSMRRAVLLKVAGAAPASMRGAPEPADRRPPRLGRAARGLLGPLRPRRSGDARARRPARRVGRRRRAQRTAHGHALSLFSLHASSGTLILITFGLCVAAPALSDPAVGAPGADRRAT